MRLLGTACLVGIHEKAVVVNRGMYSCGSRIDLNFSYCSKLSAVDYVTGIVNFILRAEGTGASYNLYISIIFVIS